MRCPCFKLTLLKGARFILKVTFLFYFTHSHQKKCHDHIFPNILHFISWIHHGSRAQLPQTTMDLESSGKEIVLLVKIPQTELVNGLIVFSKLFDLNAFSLLRLARRPILSGLWGALQMSVVFSQTKKEKRWPCDNR